ncbi:MAG: TlyA family RNA methyltransferase [Planctomycetes bacterium]|nr:TlyA family RNA methyltransferase [Planctomycetota bacterium]
MTQPDRRYVSRGGVKLEAALRGFALSVQDLTVADFGSHTGGFVDCLLQHGAAKVYAVEPGYGVLDYRLRRDPRVVVCERQNALHAACPEPCDAVTIDVGWTRQALILPAARRWLKPGGFVVTLVKPHYEADQSLLHGGVLPAESLDTLLARLRDEAQSQWTIENECESPIRGHGGNTEYLWLLRVRT